MKKVKIMLVAITVLAGVGGALAFKAKAFITPNVYCSTYNPVPGPTCQLAAIPQNLQTTFVPNVPSRTPCATDTKYYTENKCITTFTTTAIAVYDVQPF